jgi:hypothetical protein
MIAEILKNSFPYKAFAALRDMYPDSFLARFIEWLSRMYSVRAFVRRWKEDWARRQGFAALRSGSFRASLVNAFQLRAVLFPCGRALGNSGARREGYRNGNDKGKPVIQARIQSWAEKDRDISFHVPAYRLRASQHTA